MEGSALYIVWMILVREGIHELRADIRGNPLPITQGTRNLVPDIATGDIVRF